MKSKIKDFVPPAILRMVKGKSKYGWFGDFPNWDEALKHCSGYSAANILDKCKSSLLKVKNGEAVYERDSVLFDKVQYSWPVLAALLRCANEDNGELNVLDFGGSLGSSYYQNKSFLTSIKQLTWSIVEQSNFVACGKETFEDQTLKFYPDIETLLKEQSPNLVLLSSVLQYLRNPHDWIQKFCQVNAPYILIDRTPFINRNDDVITVQRVPPSIYEASYPCWGFNEKRFLHDFEGRYRLVCEFDALDRSNYIGMYFKGFILKKIQ